MELVSFEVNGDCVNVICGSGIDLLPNAAIAIAITQGGDFSLRLRLDGTDLYRFDLDEMSQDYLKGVRLDQASFRRVTEGVGVVRSALASSLGLAHALARLGRVEVAYALTAEDGDVVIRFQCCYGGVTYLRTFTLSWQAAEHFFKLGDTDETEEILDDGITLSDPHSLEDGFTEDPTKA